MNTELQDLWADSLEETEDLLGETFTFKGSEITGIISDLEISSSLNGDGGGFLNTFGVVVMARKELFPEVPVAGGLMTVRGKTVKIEKVSMDELCYELSCIAVTA